MKPDSQILFPSPCVTCESSLRCLAGKILGTLCAYCGHVYEWHSVNGRLIALTYPCTRTNTLLPVRWGATSYKCMKCHIAHTGEGPI